jgi:hypothetical protein
MQDEVTISIFFARVEEFRYLGINLTDQNSIQEEIKNRPVRECLQRIFCLPVCSLKI